MSTLSKDSGEQSKSGSKWTWESLSAPCSFPNGTRVRIVGTTIVGRVIKGEAVFFQVEELKALKIGDNSEVTLKALED